MRIEILDTTLRDGEQTPGVNFTLAEKLAIATELDRAGVDWIEAGTPAMGLEEQRAIGQMLKMPYAQKIVTWNRAHARDLELSLGLGAKWIHLSLPTSDQMLRSKLKMSRIQALDRLRDCLEFLIKEGVGYSVGAEDASRADDGFLLDYLKVAQGLGAKRLRLCDTVGILDPFGLYEKFKPLAEVSEIDLEIHNHDDYGMATANSLAALKAGFSVVDATVLGLGERAGNAPLEELALVIPRHLQADCRIRPERLKSLARLVSKAAKKPIPHNKSVVGSSVFCHESGIHVDGVIKDPENYEPFSPELVGAKRRILLGKHSGRAAIRYKLAELGLKPGIGDLRSLVERIRKIASGRKGGLKDHELRRLLLD